MDYLLLDISCMATINHHRVAILIGQIVEVIQRDHAVFDAEVMNILMNQGIVRLVGEWAATDCDVIEESTRATVGRMNGAKEAPTFRQQLTHCCCLHLGEVGTSVDGSEMREKTHVIKLIGNNAESFILHKIEASFGFEVTCG